MRALVVAIVLVGSVGHIARADDTLDAGLTLVDEMKKDSDGSQLDDHLAALKMHAGELAKLHKDHKKEKAINAKLDAAEKAAKDALALGAQAKKVVKNKRLFAAADKKLKAKLGAYASAANAANTLLAKASSAPAADPTPSAPSAPKEGAGGARIASTTCKKVQFVVDSASGKLSIRAVFLDARRKQSRELAANNAAVTKADDYELAFSVHDRKADWKVVDESYEWKETNAKSGVVLATSRKSSKEVAKNDTLEITAPPGGETVVGKISAAIAWKNGATEENDKEDCAFELSVGK